MFTPLFPDNKLFSKSFFSGVECLYVGRDPCRLVDQLVLFQVFVISVKKQVRKEVQAYVQYNPGDDEQEKGNIQAEPNGRGGIRIEVER